MVETLLGLYPQLLPVEALHMAYADGLITRRECTEWEYTVWVYERLNYTRCTFTVSIA